MNMLKRLRSMFNRLFTLGENYLRTPRTPFKEMPTTYFMIVGALSAAIGVVISPRLMESTSLFFEELLPAAPWNSSAAVGILLLAWWFVVGISVVIATKHGRALGDRLFD